MFAVSNDASMSGPAASEEAEYGRGRERDYTVPSVAAATRILQWLGGRCETLTQISEALALSKSTTYAILKTLQQAGFLGYDEATKQYCLGVQLLALGEAAANRLDYLATVRPLLRALASDTGLTGLIAQRVDDRLVVVHKEEGSADVRATMSIGQVLPLGAGAIGKAYAAFAHPQLIGNPGELRLVAFTPHSIVDPSRYVTELELTRDRGYATSYQEYRQGVNAVAAPVFDHRGRVVLIMSLIGFATALPPEAMAEYGERLRGGCAAASQALGMAEEEPRARASGVMPRQPDCAGSSARST